MRAYDENRESRLEQQIRYHEYREAHPEKKHKYYPRVSMFKKMLVALVVFCAPVQLNVTFADDLAADPNSGTTYTGSTDTQNNGSSGSAVGNETNAPIITGPGTGSSSASTSAGNNMAKGIISGGMNVATGWMMINTGNTMNETTPGSGTPFIAMGVLSFAQAGMTLAEAMNSKNSKNAATLGSNNFNYDPTDTGTTDLNGTGGLTTTSTGGTTSTDIQRALNDLKNQGYAYNANDGTITTPDGTFKASDFSSAASMSSAMGIPLSQAQATFNKAQQIAAKVSAGYKVSGVDVESGGGGGGGSSAKFTYDPGSIPNFNMFGKKREPTAVAGMQKLAGGDPIGVAADDIFKMMNRRYTKLDGQARFLDK